MSTMKYIMELQNKVRELENCIEKRNTTSMESTQLTPTDCTGMKRDSVPKITLHYYNGTAMESDCTESAQIVTEPKMADPSPMGNGLTSLMADYSDIWNLILRQDRWSQTYWRWQTLR
jgi:hypothetical protein